MLRTHGASPAELPFSHEEARAAMQAARVPYRFTGKGFQRTDDPCGRVLEAVDILIDNATGEVKRHGAVTEVRDFLRRLKQAVERDVIFEDYVTDLSLMTFKASASSARRINLSIAYPDFALATYSALRAKKAALAASIPQRRRDLRRR